MRMADFALFMVFGFLGSAAGLVILGARFGFNAAPLAHDSKIKPQFFLALFGGFVAGAMCLTWVL